MKKTLESAWNNKIPIIIGIIFVFVLAIITYWAIYPNSAPLWTGFGEYQKSTGETERAKTLWDWMNLLIVPLMVATGIWYLNKTEKSYEQKIATDRTNEQILQSYLDYMTDLMLKENLLKNPEQDGANSIARARTIATLRSLDPSRKGLLVNFLYEANLISRESIVTLKGADITFAILDKLSLANVNFKYANLRNSSFRKSKLSGANFQCSQLYFSNFSRADLITTEFYLADLYSSDLSNATLISANFSSAKMERANLKNSLISDAVFYGANLSRANLQNTDLTNANLARCNLYKANLQKANLSGANLQGANLVNADLRGAVLDQADLSLANLTNAKLEKYQLKNVKSLELTTMMDGKLQELIE